MQRIQKDGNCFYRAISHQLYTNDTKHQTIRECSANYIRRNKNYYKPFLTEDIESYCQKLATNGVWADNVAIDSTAKELNIRIDFYENFHLKYTVNESSPVVANLIYKNQNHFDSIIDINTWLNFNPVSKNIYFDKCSTRKVKSKNLKNKKTKNSLSKLNDNIKPCVDKM